ncbi:MAG: YadA-like family protein, partial [Campylobacter sp.]|nr:YadA-like family protein [Campylobacter sp.]
VKKVIPSAQGENGTTDTRITYNTGSGGTETLATLNDGLKFAGDINQNNQPINKNLNDTLNITGGVTDSAKLTNNNIGVVNDGSDLIVKLAKDIDLGQDGSVTIGNTVINNSGLTIGSGSSAIKITDNNISMGGQQIHDVAAGTADTDAVNVGQLNNAVNNAVTNINNNITDINNTIGDISNLKTYDVQNQTGNQATSVVEAINRMNDQGIKFFHTNDGQNNQQGNTSGSTDDASASGKYSTAIGYRANAGGENSLAMGNGATVGAGATNSIAIGTGSNVTGLNSIAIGTGHQVSGSNIGAFGNPSYIDADNSYGIGNNNRIENTATQSFAIGNSNTISTANTYVLGSGVTSTVENSLFFGNNAAYINEITDPDKSKGRNSAYTNDTITVQNANGQNIDVVMNFAGGNQVVGVVSVGNANETRRIQGVAPGLVSKDSTDAINGSQLYSAIEGVSAHIGNQINQTNQAVNNLAQQLGDARKEARSGTASAIAIGNLPQSTMPGKGMLSVGTGYYKDEGALSLGLSKMSDNGKWIFKSSLSYDTQENVGAGLSLGFHF